MRSTALAFVSSVVVAGCSASEASPAGSADGATEDVGALDAATDSVADAVLVDATPRPSSCPRKTRNVTIPATCNGSAALCDRRFDQVVLPTTHNAMSVADEGFIGPNQRVGIAKQLQDGIRGMMLDTYYFTPAAGTMKTRIEGTELKAQAHLCHVVCEIGKRPMLDGLCDIVDFLDQNRGEVVSIIFESNVSDADTVKLVEDSGLSDYVYTYKGGAWPTMRELIANDTRLLLFTESGGGTPAWYHPAWSVIWDTPYDYASTSAFTCALNRGSKTNPLYLVNHWLNDAAPGDRATRAVTANAKDMLEGRLKTCAAESGRAVNFLAVDYYDVGALRDVVRAANGP